MLITHDTRCALDTVVDLVNTVPEDESAPDGLPDVAALQHFVGTHEISDVGVLTDLDLSAVRVIRGRFAAVFAAPDARTAAGLINDLVAAAGTTPRLTDHDGYDWHGGGGRRAVLCPLRGESSQQFMRDFFPHPAPAATFPPKARHDGTSRRGRKPADSRPIEAGRGS
ncbi:ABATE domain-containing protein [Streptomyces tendae]